MKRRTYIITSILLVCIIVTLVLMLFYSSSSPIETEEQAIKIAETYVFKKYGHRFIDAPVNNIYNYTIKAKLLEDDIWLVYYLLLGPNGEIDFLGGGGPQLEIKKSNGKVISCSLQA